MKKIVFKFLMAIVIVVMVIPPGGRNVKANESILYGPLCWSQDVPGDGGYIRCAVEECGEWTENRDPRGLLERCNNPY
ncbi:hypothetical protein [Roseivirga sp.]|uniref:hypothetical protein n=1 Tax=Roseivirga sp. TaxID=1964215 RepID=UPI003B8AE8D7